ncbi:unnamed protein product [Haemonchus placei]|uniref:Amidase domain-containing protein n=1 Tax=Haemonchus placei TaxID=6290 RepID=A0A0N4WWD5_HAEPC|nr:unnamed protein product [Haemonchus placei]
MGNILPWGAQAKCRRAIEKNEKSRSQGFADFQTRIATNSDDVLEKRKQIVSWTLLELRGEYHFLSLFLLFTDILCFSDRLQRDELTAVQALEAYVWKALQLQERNNCCIEVLREAFDTAAEADKMWSGVKEKPPLFGIPFSVKGNFFMPGYDCTLGLAKFLEQPKLEECTMVTHLRNLGAVSWFCCLKFWIYPPWDLFRSPGGSSGGEGALFAGGGTPFGIGSDLAGSLRIPAAFCGFVTLKPSQERLVVKNTHGGVPGRGRLGLSFGFFTHTVEEQVELLQTIVGNPEYIKLVPTSIAVPLDKKIAKTDKLRIGYYDDDGFCPAVPCVKRVLLETVERLKAEGHELIRFKIPNVDEMVQLLYKLLMPDGGRYVRALYDNDIVDPYLKEFVTLLKVPHWLRSVASYILQSISPQLSALSAAYVSDLDDLRYTQEMCDAYKDKFTEYWKSLGIDALICPTFPVPAVPHRFPSRMSSAATYTGLYNLLDYPAGAVPAGKVTSEDDQDLLDESKYPVGIVGLPLSVQVVTLPYEEEKCLRVMSEVERIWNNNGVSESFVNVSP